MKYTVITGATSGLGRGAAHAFAERGKNLILAARRLEVLEEVKAEILKTQNVEIVLMKVDLSDMEQVKDFYDRTRAYDVECWINNAGFGDVALISELDLEKAEKIIDVNCKSVMILTSLYAADYKDVEGTQLINVSSAGGYTIVPEEVIYSAGKFFVSAFTEGLAMEFKAAGNRMQAKILAPANTETGYCKVAFGVDSFDYSQFVRYHQVEDVIGFLMQLYDSEKPLGIVDRKTFEFELCDVKLPNAY